MGGSAGAHPGEEWEDEDDMEEGQPQCQTQ